MGAIQIKKIIIFATPWWLDRLVCVHKPSFQRATKLGSVIELGKMLVVETSKSMFQLSTFTYVEPRQEGDSTT